MPKMGKQKPKGVSTGDGSKTVVKGKKTFPSRYTDGLSEESKIVMKEGTSYSSRYK